MKFNVEEKIIMTRLEWCRANAPKAYAGYSDDELFVDFLGGPKGEQTCRYIYPSYQRVFADIDRYYEDGIIPQGDGF